MKLRGYGTFIRDLYGLIVGGFIFLLCMSVSQADDSIQLYHGKKIRSGEFLVKLRNPLDSKVRISNASTQNFMSNVGQKHHLKLVKSFSGINLHHMKMDPQDLAVVKDADDLMSSLKSDNPEISYIEPDYIVEKLTTPEPNQAFSTEVSETYTLNQVLSFIGQSYGITSVPIQAQTSWTVLSTTSPSVTVAVIDTGIDFNHTALSRSIWTNTGEVANNGVDDDRNGYVDDVHGWNFVSHNNAPQDDNGHGTHVSGIVVGTGNNIFAAPNAPTTIQIMPLKFLDSNGAGATSDAINAIYYAANNGAHIINNSWGGGAYSTALVEAIAYAYTKDALFVAAAGNASINNDSSPNYPSSYTVPNVIAVAASDTNDNLAYFSNFGHGSVALSAPGVSILSTWLGNAYAYLSGTSMATPFVSGAAALMKYQTPQMNSYQISQLVALGVNKSSALTSVTSSGGRLNVLNAVNLSMSATVSSTQPSYTVTISNNDRELASAFANQGSGCGSVGRIVEDQAKLRGIIVSLGLILLPVFFVMAMREKAPEGAARRKFDRYSMNSKMILKIGDQELEGAIKTISMGGSEINTSALLKNGSIINMVISSPDGREKIEVQGNIVWSESQKRYGVAFSNVSEAVKAQIGQWQQALQKV